MLHVICQTALLLSGVLRWITNTRISLGKEGPAIYFPLLPNLYHKNNLYLHQGGEAAAEKGAGEAEKVTQGSPKKAGEPEGEEKSEFNSFNFWRAATPIEILEDPEGPSASEGQK